MKHRLTQIRFCEFGPGRTCSAGGWGAERDVLSAEKICVNLESGFPPGIAVEAAYRRVLNHCSVLTMVGIAQSPWLNPGPGSCSVTWVAPEARKPS